jgi:hypothetical protein
MLPSFRTVKSLSELLEAFELCRKDRLELTIWQNLGDSRETGTCLIQKIIQNNNILIFLSLDTGFSYDEDLEFHLFQQELSLLFKGFFHEHHQGTLVLNLNKKFFLKEKRENERFAFKEILFKVRVDYLDLTSGNKKTLNGILSDISDMGLSFLVPVTNSIILSEGMTVSLKSIEGITFSNPILGVIRYHVVIKSSNQTDVKYGMEFKQRSKPISQALDLLKTKLT